MILSPESIRKFYIALYSALCFGVCFFVCSLIFCEEIPSAETANTASLETDVSSVSFQQTIDRLKQIEQSVLLESHPPFAESPTLDLDRFLHNELQSTQPISKTSEPFMKEQIIASKKSDITPSFEDIFLLLSDEMQLKVCKKICAETPQEFVQKIIYYLGKGTPEQALIINQLLPHLKNELEEPLLSLLENNPEDITEKRTIIYILGRIQSEKSVSLIWNELQNAPTEQFQYTCVQALANMPHALPLEQWVQLIQSDSVSVSLTSAYAIMEYGGSSAEEYIRRILLGEFRVPQRVLDYLVNRISNYPLDILVPFAIEVMEANPNLAQKFASILQQRTGQKLGPYPQLWSNWWKEYINGSENPTTPENALPPPNDNGLPPDVKVHSPVIKKR
jgi:hypothetical protein